MQLKSIDDKNEFLSELNKAANNLSWFTAGR